MIQVEEKGVIEKQRMGQKRLKNWHGFNKVPY